MQVRKFKIAKIGGGIVIILLVAQVGTYWLMAPRRISWTVDRFLPQHTHFTRGTQFAFACVSNSTARALRDGDKEALRAHLQHWFPTVYTAEGSIPASAKEELTNKAGEKVLLGLKGGCILMMQVEKQGVM